MMNGESGLVVDHPFGSATLHDVAIRTDEQEVRDGHISEWYTERINPEVITFTWVTECEVTSNTFLEAEHAEDTKSLRKPLLASLSLLLRCVVRGRLGELELGSVLLDLLGTRLGGRDIIGSSRRRHDGLAG